MTWPPPLQILLWAAGIVAALLLAFYLFVYEAFQPATPLSRLQRRIEMARVTTVLDQPRVINGFPLPAGTEVVWEDPSHRRLQAATLRAPTEILGVRATGLLRVLEDGWLVGLAEAQDIDGWTCAKGEVELTTAGRLRNCELSGTPTWRGWSLPPCVRPATAGTAPGVAAAGLCVPARQAPGIAGRGEDALDRRLQRGRLAPGEHV